MSGVQKTINILEEIPQEIAEKISMKMINEVLSIMFSSNDDENFEPTFNDFIEALYIRINIEKGLDDIKNNKIISHEELKEEIMNAFNLDSKSSK